MDELLTGSPAQPTHADRLESWKEIAAYLRRDVTTAQRWERREGMPVHRHLHDRSSSVYAFRTELDAWTRSRAGRAVQSTVTESFASRWRAGWRWWLGGVALASVVAAGVALVWTRATAWSNPLDGARTTLVTDFEGTEHAAALSRDGRMLAFLSDRDGRPDVWLTRLGTGQFTNLTHGAIDNLVNPSVRNIGFSPDAQLVTFWTRRPGANGKLEIGVWAVAVAGGPPRPYLDGAAEFDWSHDGARLVYHTPAPGDPTYIRERDRPGPGRLIFAAPEGLHGHYPLWAPGDDFIYFARGAVAEAMDVWRIRATGGVPERITRHNSRVSDPVMLDRRTLMYLATDQDGGGPWLYTVDVEERVARRVSTGVDTYTSLSASADGRRVAATLARPRETLWQLALSDAGGSAPARIDLPTGHGASPRLGPDYLVYVSSAAGSDAIWKLAGQNAACLWSEPGARVLGGPAVSPDGRNLAFSVAREGRTRLMAVGVDGEQSRVLTDALDLRGGPAWAPDGKSLSVPAAVGAAPALFNVSLDGRSVRFSPEYSVGPAWSPDGRFVVYSGPDVGTTFRVKAMRADGSSHPLPDITLTRGARALRFLPGARALLVLRGGIEHKDLWAIDLDTGAERQVTRLPPDFQVRDFDVSPDGREVVLDRVQDQSDIVLLELARR